jgi:WD40 repeat protein
MGLEGAVLVWDLHGKHRFAPTMPLAKPITGSASAALPAPGGTVIAYVGADTAPDGRPRTWLRFVDLATGRTGPLLDTRHESQFRPAWRPDGGRLATTGADGHVRTWDPTTGALVADRVLTSAPAAALTYSADGLRIVTAGEAGTVSQIDAKTLKPVASPIDVGDRVWFVAVTPDGRTAVTIGENRTAHSSDNAELPVNRYAVVDLYAGRVAQRRILPDDGVAVAVAPAGDRVAIGGSGGRLLLLDLADGRIRRSAVAGHESTILSVGYAADGDTVVTGGYDGRVALWDAHTGDLLGTMLPGEPDTGTQPAFQADSDSVVIPGWDGTVHIWNTRPASWLRFACTVAARDLTRDEWTAALGKRPYRQTCPR